MILLLAVAASLAIYRFLEMRAENVVGVAEPADFFRSDSERLTRLGRVALPPHSSGAGEWSQWRGQNRTAVSQEKLSSDSWSSGGPRRLWSVAGGAGHSSIAVGSGRAFTLVQAQDEEAAICLEAATGRRLWTTRWTSRFEETSAGVGPHATPTVADGRVYTVGSTGQFHCLDATSGAVLWRHDLLQEFGRSQPQYGVSVNPLVEGDLVIVQPGARGAAIAAFDRRDGRRIWNAGDDPDGYSSPMAATIAGQRQIVFLTGESVMGSDVRDGRNLWRVPWRTNGDYNIATPVIVQDYVFVSSGYGKGCALLEITRDAKGSFEARPVYEHPRMRNQFSTCVLWGDHLYGFDDSFLVCMEFRTGKIRWKERGFGKGSLIAADGKLIVLGEEGKLALVEARPDGYRELSSSRVSTTRCWASPSLSGGLLFIRDQESIQCFDLRPSK